MRRASAGWLLLVPVFLLFLWLLHRSGPAVDFGRFHDDTFYFSSARSLAQGEGYRLPSVPGIPPHTKYPVLYPWLLSGIWRWNPSFPANVQGALWLTALFSCWFLAAAFQFLRTLAEWSDGTSLTLVALCAFHPLYFFMSGAVMSDIPFAALAMTAAVAGEPALRRQSPPWMAAAAGTLAGVSMLVRTFGIAVVAGLVACALWRRAWRQAVWLALAASPFLVFGLLGQAAPPAEGAPGWRQTWLFYSSYGQFWKLCVPSWAVFQAMAGFNLQTLLRGPSTLCLFPTPGGHLSYPGVIFSITLSAGILAGVARQARRTGWRPLHFILLAHVPIIIAWNYALVDRFLLPFLPLLYAGLWSEMGHLIALLRANLAGTRSLGERALAGLLALGLALIVALAASHYFVASRTIMAAERAGRAALAPEKQQVYDWARRNTPPSARFIAYEDISLYLHTGRQAMRPIIFSTAAFAMKDEQILERDLANILDVARHIRARYWVMADDDFHMETGIPLIEKKMRQLQAALPLVFRSSGDRVRVYDLSAALAHEGPPTTSSPQ